VRDTATPNGATMAPQICQLFLGITVIIGTAGHIDHGKTSLVKALTGVDTDRLKEEKERGITVDLGFAYRALDDGQMLGFVDVPGHEKLVHNMLAGATGIDHVLLVVAADDGPMPQTREHLAILDLLGLSRGAVALTKVDLVSPQRLDEAIQEVRAMLAPTVLADAPVLPVSSHTRQGLDALEHHLAQARLVHSAQPAGGAFRLAVDRSFSLAGVGTVVTGTAVSGQVAVGDSLLVSPAGREVRVRGLHALNRSAPTGHAGQRLALNLAGIDKQDIQRGDWIVAAAAHAPTQRIDARLNVLPGEAKALAHWTPVHLHLGAVDVSARIALLEGVEGEAIAPGSSARVQLELSRPIGALHGDRFIVRDQSALRTIGGGAVLDIFAPANSRQGKRKSARLAWLAAMEQAHPEDALRQALALEPANGLHWGQFCTLWNLQAGAHDGLLQAVPHRMLEDGAARLLFTPGQIEQFGARTLDLLKAFHQRQPDSPGMGTEQLQRAMTLKPGGNVFALLLRELQQAGALARSGAAWRLPSHVADLQGAEKHLWERLKPWLDEGGTAPPKLSDLLLRDRTLRKDQVMRMFERAQRLGKVYAVGAEYMVQREHVLQLALAAQKLAQADPNKRINVKELREATGMSRHLSIPLMEFFDAVGFTQRDALGRHIRRDAHKMFGT
jgi:selenocysteine-specific elongation factor